MRRAVLPLLLVAFFVLLSGLTAAEEPAAEPVQAALAQIDSGRAALVAGNAQEAIDRLQRAIGIIQAKVARSLSSYLPASVGDLVGGEVDIQSGSWGAGDDSFQWNSATRTYRRAPDDARADDDLSVEVMISNSPQLLEVHKASFEMYENPQMREMLEKSGNVKIETIREGAWKGFILSQPDQGAQVLAVAERMMLQIQSSSGDMALMKKFWKAIDTEGLARVK